MAESATRFALRYERLKAASVHCPDCNEQLVNEKAIRVHKAMGGCTVVPGARARLAALIAGIMVGRVL
jgi:hypothetical protein